MSDKEKIILIGYNPLFYMPEGYSPGSALNIPSQDSLSDLINSIPQVQSSGVLWVSNGQQIKPVIMIEKAKQIKDHLEYWSQGEPEKWFKFYHRSYTYKDHQGYMIILQPDLSKSLERYKFSNTFFASKRINVSDCVIFYQPISVVATKSENYTRFAQSKSTKVNISLVDKDEVLAMQGDYSKITESMLYDIGTYDIAKPSWYNVGERSKNVIKEYIQTELCS